MEDDGANSPQRGFAGEFKLCSITDMPEPCAGFSGLQLISTFGIENMTTNYFLVTLIALQIVLIGLTAFYVRRFIMKQKNPIAARVRLIRKLHISVVSISLIGIVFLVMKIILDGSISVAGFPIFFILLTVSMSALLKRNAGNS